MQNIHEDEYINEFMSVGYLLDEATELAKIAIKYDIDSHNGIAQYSCMELMNAMETYRKAR